MLRRADAGLSAGRVLGVGLSAFFLATVTMADVSALIARGDSAWLRRAEGHVGDRGAPGPIGEAIAAYDEALEQVPDNLEARWKLMRALFFLGEHVVEGRIAQLGVFGRARDLGEEGIEQLAAVVGSRKRLFASSTEELHATIPEPTLAAETLFWSAVHTGLWGRTRGKMASAREGVAGKIRDYAKTSLALDPTIENGGGHRVLGRLHTEAPRIPFITGWIDRSTAVEELERCREFAPDDLTTRLYLGEALAEFVPKRRQEGLRLLESMLDEQPDPAWIAEGLKAIADAKAVLARFE